MSSVLKNKYFFIILILGLGILNAAYFLLRQSDSLNTEHITIDTFKLANAENIQIVRAPKPEKGLVLFIAKKNNAKVNQTYARKFAALSYYVAILEDESLLNAPANESQCLNLSKQLITISSQLQQHFKLSPTELPILVGMDDASATVYAALAQAEKQIFHAAVAINLPTALQTHSPLCSQENFTEPTQGSTPLLKPVKRLPTSFYVFQNEHATNVANKAFTDNIGNLKLTLEENTDNALSEAIQILQWLDPRLEDQRSSDTSDSDLPIIEVPISEDTATQNQTLAVLITGDGGWAAIDKNIARILAEKNIPTVALDALSYFWKARTPEETTKDVETIISQYLSKWNKKDVILIGYSFGADVLPFIANNFSDETKKQLSLVALLGMGKTAAFEFKLSSWMNADTSSSRLPLLPEVEKMKWTNSICIYGMDDPSTNCLATQELGVKAISMPGDHHFNEKYDELVQHIVENIKPAH